MGPTFQEAMESFDYHKPNETQVRRIEEIRVAHKQLLVTIWNLVPSGADRSAAVRKLHECMMTCNKAIVLETPVRA